MARQNKQRPGFLGIGIAVALLAVAACGKHSNTTPVVISSAAPAVSAGPTSPPCTLTLGFAYEPAGGNPAGQGVIQVVHFEDNNQNLCGGVSPTAIPTGVTLPAPVGAVAFSTDVSDAVALMQSGSGFTLAQDVFGSIVANLVPSGLPYNLDAQPPLTSATATPVPAPLIPNVTGATIIGTGNTALGLFVGPGVTPGALVALNNFTNAPPQYASNIPYSATGYTLKSVAGPYSIVRAGIADSSGATPVLVRGPSDMALFKVVAVGAGFQFNLIADNTSLGYGPSTVLQGNGNIAFDPADATRALVGGNSTGTGSVLTLVSALPGQITSLASITLPGNINSIVIATNGVIAVVGTDAGIVTINGVNGSSLTIQKPFEPFQGSTQVSAIPYTNCNNTSSFMTDVQSIGVSAGSIPNTTNNYLVALGTAPGLSCASGNNSALVAVPFDTVNGTIAAPGATPSPVASASPLPTPPAVYTQNNVVPPPAGADYLLVH